VECCSKIVTLYRSRIILVTPTLVIAPVAVTVYVDAGENEFEA